MNNYDVGTEALRTPIITLLLLLLLLLHYTNISASDTVVVAVSSSGLYCVVGRKYVQTGS